MAKNPPEADEPAAPELVGVPEGSATQSAVTDDPLSVEVSPVDPGTPEAEPSADDPTESEADPRATSAPVAEANPDTVLPTGAATPPRAPAILPPVVTTAEPTEAEPVKSEPPPEPPAVDPEQVLASYQWRFHHETLRELVDEPDELRTIRDRLTEKLEPAKDNGTRARLLSLRAVVSRILGDLDKALADGKLALAHAEATGQLRRIAIAQARLAHVLQWRGDFAEADRLFEEANSSELPDRLRATMHEHAGRSCYDQGRYIEACNHFEKALELRKVEDPDLIARTELALDAVSRQGGEGRLGPVRPATGTRCSRRTGHRWRSSARRCGAGGTPTPDGAVGRSPRATPTRSRSGTGWPGYAARRPALGADRQSRATC